MKVSKAHIFSWLAIVSLTGAGAVSSRADDPPAPGAGIPGDPATSPTQGAQGGGTVQLHRVVYVHAGDAGNLLQQKKFVDQYAAPPQLFPVDATPDLGYIPPPIQISGEQLSRERHAADDAKNWMLLTPEEILGVAPPKAADDPDRNLSAEDRYLKRNAQARSGTNDSDGEYSLRNRDYQHRDNGFGSLEQNDDNGNAWTRGGLNRLMGAKQGSSVTDPSRANADAPDSPWTSSIWGTAPAEDPVQAALKQKLDMQQFDHLLSPGDHPVEKAAHFGEVTPAVSPLANPLGGSPGQANTAQAVYSQLKENIGRPAALPTLTTPITTPTYQPRLKPSAPPWTLQPSRPF